MFSPLEACVAYSSQVRAAINSHFEQPVGYVFMIGTRPAGPLRESRAEAVRDAVEAKEASVDLQYDQVFYNPLTWIAPIYP
jgi:hypothetical protein